MIDDFDVADELVDSGFFGTEGSDGAEYLDSAVIALVDELVANAPAGREGLLRVLIGLQSAFNRVSWRIQELVADRYGMSPAQVAGLVSFYPELSSERRGRVDLAVCAGASCRLDGSGEMLESLIDEAGAHRSKIGESLIVVRSARCLGTCGRSPVLQANGRALAPPAAGDGESVLADLLEASGLPSEER